MAQRMADAETRSKIHGRNIHTLEQQTWGDHSRRKGHREDSRRQVRHIVTEGHEFLREGCGHPWQAGRRYRTRHQMRDNAGHDEIGCHSQKPPPGVGETAETHIRMSPASGATIAIVALTTWGGQEPGDVLVWMPNLRARQRVGRQDPLLGARHGHRCEDRNEGARHRRHRRLKHSERCHRPTLGPGKRSAFNSTPTA